MCRVSRIAKSLLKVSHPIPYSSSSSSSSKLSQCQTIASFTTSQSPKHPQQQSTGSISSESSPLPQNESLETDNLIIKITQCQTIAESLIVFVENEDIFSYEHLAQTARMIELVDLLFFSRKYKLSNSTNGNNPNQNRKGVNESEQLIQVLSAGILERVLAAVKNNNHSYDLKQLSVIFFDVSIVAPKNSDLIAQRLATSILVNPMEITPFILTNILSVISQKGNLCTAKELTLIDILCKNFNNLTTQLDISQKSQIFKQIASIDTFLHPPKYKLPGIMFELKSELKDHLDSLNEISVLNILKAYQHLLYTQFPVDLLEEIKEMVVVTIQHTPANVKSAFLLDFLESLLVLNKKRRTEPAKLQLLVNDLIRRLKENDESLLRGNRLEQLITYCDKHLKARTPLISLLASKSQIINDNASTFNLPFFELITKKGTNSEIDSILLEYFGKSESEIRERVSILSASLSRIGIVYRIAIAIFPHRERHALLFNLLKSIVGERVEIDPLSLLVAARQSNVSTAYKNEMQVKAVQILLQVNQSSPTTQGEQTDWQIIRAIFASLEFKEARIIWYQYLKAKPSIEPIFVYRFLEQFFASSEGNESFERLSFMQSVLSICCRDSGQPGIAFPIRQICQHLKDSTSVLESLAKNEYIFRQLLLQIAEAAKKYPDQIKLLHVYQICLRLESIGLRLDYFYRTMSSIYDSFHSYHNNNYQHQQEPSNLSHDNANTSSSNNSNASLLSTAPTEQYVAFLFQIKLAENNLLRVSLAKQAFANKQINDFLLKGKLLTYIGQQENEFVEQHKDSFNTYFQQLLSNLISNSQVHVLNSASSIMRLPSAFFETESGLIHNSIKKNLTSSYDQSGFVSVLLALKPSIVEAHPQLIKDILDHYILVKKRIPFSETRRILQKMSEIQLRDAKTIASMMQDINMHFTSMTHEDRVACLRAICGMHVSEPEFFDKCLIEFAAHEAAYRSSYFGIVEGFFKVGHSSELLYEYLEKALLRFSKMSFEEFAYTLALIAMIPKNNPRKKSLVQKINQKLSDPTNYFQATPTSINTNTSVVSLCLAYYSTLYSNATQILTFLQKYKAQKSTNKVFISHPGYLQIQKYLTAVGIESKLNETINHYEIPLMIPATKQIVKVNGVTNMNFDRKTLDGKSIIEQAILETIPGYSVVSINLHEFNISGTNKEPKGRIKYIASKGVKCDPSKSYDLSKFNFTTETVESNQKQKNLNKSAHGNQNGEEEVNNKENKH